ncbi:MAG: DUF5685 family protein [Oscillospiraceae bacterium]|nr:DUF5685 family protein [Oscillospiraceae bacterium]
MFGYILPCANELGECDLNFYKAVYCGICKSIGGNVGQLARYTLSYDSVFFAMALMCAQHDAAYVEEFENCAVHPLRKRRILHDSGAIDYIADINVLMALFKLLDDADDENSYRGRMLAGALRPAARRIEKRRGEEYAIINEGVRELRELESANCDILDMAAEPFSVMLAKIMRLGALKQTGGSIPDILETIGYNIGKWLYIADAFDDIEQDHAKGCYNAVLLEYQYGADEQETIPEFKRRIYGNFSFIATYTLSVLSNNIEKLFAVSRQAASKQVDSPVIRVLNNIIYSGLPRKTQAICSCGVNASPPDGKDEARI